ncbi:MAG: mycothiol synthase, partial [Georgenia sp.]
MIVEVARLGEQVAPEQVLELARAVEREDDVAALSEQTLLEVRRPTRTVEHVLAIEDGVLVGYAQVDRGVEASAELAVHPRHRRRGVGRALLDAVRRAGPVSVWAHGNLSDAQALAAGAGMRVVRELMQMSAPLGPTDAPPHHPGVTVRAFEPGRDEDAWVALNARAFAHHPEQGRMTAEDLRAREAEDWFDPALLWLAFDEDPTTPTAAMWIKVLPGSDEGEIYALGVDPDAQGRGLGRMLTRRAVAE